MSKTRWWQVTGMYGVPQYGCQFHNGIWRYLVKTILPNRLPLLFVEIALEEMHQTNKAASGHEEDHWLGLLVVVSHVFSSMLFPICVLSKSICL